ncbi:MAG: 4-demethylwyosine synthase TYW1 [Candidatus Aenigmarchaeota archaeon]|nr:4-demethylwyosine synthase TYW1 [Candidatus Aenigmarchaeota archaeon]
MLNENVKQELEKKHYKIFNHSGVQICEWTKRSLRGEGFCYKERFYGVDCHRCMQFSPSVVFCNLRCSFCWCSNKLFTNDFSGEVDEPEEIVKNLIEQRKNMLSGFGGSIANKDRLKEALEPNHFAISLSGEPTLYPKIIELIDYLTERARTVFLVTNGTVPEQLRKIKNKKNFQLYISMNAPNEEKFKEICRPAEKDSWNKFNESLEIMRNFKGRRVLRMTQIKGFNDSDEDILGYLKLIEKGSPDFVEVKSFMSLGDSKERMGDDKMPDFENVKKFALKLSEESNYKFEDEAPNSRIVLLKNKDSKVVNKFE